MQKYFVTYKFLRSHEDNLQKLITFLEECRKKLNQDEDNEVAIVCNMRDAQIFVGMTKLAPKNNFIAGEPISYVPGEYISLEGVLDELANDGHWNRIHPIRKK